MIKFQDKTKSEKEACQGTQKNQRTAERPRLCVFRSAKHIYAQIIDDESGQTLVAASTLDEALKGKTGLYRQQECSS